MTGTAGPRVGQLARMLAVSERARESRVESLDVAEAATSSQATPDRPADILEIVEANLPAPPEIDPADWARARDLLMRHAGGALSKVATGDLALSPDEGIAMEAVIISDGTRPSFPLCRGEVAADDPFLGQWGGKLAAAETAGIATLAQAVGRIQPAFGHASNFFGTGSLIDRDRGLVLTNYHVVRQAQAAGIATDPTPTGFRVRDGLEIDFLGEWCSPNTRRFRVVEVVVPPGAGEVFAGVDAAVLRIEPLDADAELPRVAAGFTTNPDYITGARPSLALIGFPARPRFLGEGVDWDFVLRTLFQDRFGVKRLAPGLFYRPLGSHPDDAVARRAIGHDATTFGGASGSLVAAWLDGNTPAFALHFGGSTSESNYALSFAAGGVRDVLAGIGVPLL